VDFFPDHGQAGGTSNARRMAVALTLGLAIPSPDSKSLSSDPTAVLGCRRRPDDYCQDGYKFPIAHITITLLCHGGTSNPNRTPDPF
jgi:hypothetical protein